MTRQHATNLCILLLICVVALGLRLPGLDKRPMHADEAVQAVRFSEMMAGQYAYIPTEFHGPAMYIFAWPIAWAQGKTTLAAMTESDLRIVPVLLGVATILLLYLLRDALGTPAVLLAALFAAVAPALTYYNRYFIHESLLVFLTVATIATLWRYRQRPCFGWSITAGASFGLLYATKTTWAIAAVCALMAWGLTVLWQRLASTPAASACQTRCPSAQIRMARGGGRGGGGWLIVIVLFHFIFYPAARTCWIRFWHFVLMLAGAWE